MQVLLGSHLLKPASNVDTYSTENLQYDEQVDGLSSYLHDTFCYIPHHEGSRQFLLIEWCKFRFHLAILEYSLMLFFQELVISLLGILHPFSIPISLLPLYFSYYF